MPDFSRRHVLGLLAAPLFLSACGAAGQSGNRRERRDPRPDEPPLYPNETPELRRLINKYADHYEVPRPLVHRLAIRESTHNPRARNGPYYGLLQILPATAGSMGFRGKPTDLLDAETNLKYAVKYLRGAWLLADGSQDRAVSWYARGYYYEAKRRNMLIQTGLRQG